MQYTNLGRTGLKVSRLCLGTLNFGSETNEPDSLVIMTKALELGINFFDTADHYGQPEGRGITEEIIGRWLAQDRSRRDRIVLATKVYHQVGEGINRRGLSAYHIRQACEDSLRRLQTDHIDLYQMHHIDRRTPWEEIWQAMEQLVREGKVIYIGSSNFAGWHIAQAQGEAARRNFMGLVSEQSLYNLRARTVELEVIPACRNFGLGLLPWSPLSSGLLGGKKGSQVRRLQEEVRTEQSRFGKQIEAYEQFCLELGEEPGEVALAWLLHNPVVSSPILGPRTVEQLENSLRSLEIHLSETEIQRLNTIWPGPGGEAPEAYAW
jgi:aryl-alcohol dehydrogenase-like predicted oxidoreductase